MYCKKCKVEMTVKKTQNRTTSIFVCPNCKMEAYVHLDHPSLNTRPGLIGPEQGKPTPGLRG